MTIDIARYVRIARSDAGLSDRAWLLTAQLLENCTQEHKKQNGLRGSYAGKCTVELQAILRGDQMLPDDAISGLYRLDAGTLIGARIQALFKAGYEYYEGPERVRLEFQSTYLGVTSHADIAVFAPTSHKCIFSADIKTNYFPGKPRNPDSPDEPKDDHLEYVLQAGHQAAGLGNEDFAVFMVAMSDGNYKGEPPIYGKQFDFKLSQYKDRIDAEYERLKRALDPTANLTCDFPCHQTWRMRYCKKIDCYSRARKESIPA